MHWPLVKVQYWISATGQNTLWDICEFSIPPPEFEFEVQCLQIRKKKKKESSQFSSCVICGQVKALDMVNVSNPNPHPSKKATWITA